LKRWVFEPGHYTIHWENGEVSEISSEETQELIMLTNLWAVVFYTSWEGPEDVNLVFEVRVGFS